MDHQFQLPDGAAHHPEPGERAGQGPPRGREGEWGTGAVPACAVATIAGGFLRGEPLPETAATQAT